MRNFKRYWRFRLRNIYSVHKDADGSFYEVEKGWQWAMFLIEILSTIILAVI